MPSKRKDPNAEESRMSEADPSGAPFPYHRLWTALEAPRAALEAQSLVPAWPLLRRAPRGDGHGVLVLPGFLASDRSTRLLRGFLRERGYSAHGWALGRNLGPEAGLASRLRARLLELSLRHRGPVSLIGWSLGGVFARELAKRLPERVRQVITLASPFGGPDAPPPPVPTTAIYTRSDGIVAWQRCREADGPQTDNLEIVGSHCGLGVHPLALYAIADRLAQAPDAWKPFDRGGWRGALYR
jgi:pimeloyl-ACP methyl ester carboxylesterase